MRIESSVPDADIDYLEESGSAVSLPHAGLGRRFAAFLLDVVFAFVTFVLVVAAIGFFNGLLGLRVLEFWAANKEVFTWIVAIVTTFAYFAIPEARTGATLGKRLVRIRVVSEQGHPIDWSASLLRNLLRPVDVIGGFLYALPGPRHRRVGDRVADTVVISASPGAR